MQTERAREDRVAARRQLEAGDTSGALARIDDALVALGQEPWLTTAAAAAALGVRSPDLVTFWWRRGPLTGERQGGALMIAPETVEHFRHTHADRLQAARLAESVHAATATLGSDDGLEDEVLRALEADRPGRLPWARPSGE